MFLVKSMAKYETPLNTVSDLWKTLDEKMFPKFKGELKTIVGVGYFRQHAFELFKSYYDLGLFNNKQLLDTVPTFLTDYLRDRFNVPEEVLNKVEPFSIVWKPKSWNERE